MARRINRVRLKAFILRRRTNVLGLLAITVFSAAMTALGAVLNFRRTDVLAVVTVLLMLLCLVQMLRMKKSFRTMRTFRGIRKKKA